MYKILGFCLLICCVYTSEAQRDSMYVEWQVKSIERGDDTIPIMSPARLVLRKPGKTEIISIANSGSWEIGMQMELLYSELDGTASFPVGVAFFYRRQKSGWKMLGKPDYQIGDFMTIPGRPGTSGPSFANNFRECFLPDGTTLVISSAQRCLFFGNRLF